MRGAAGSVLTPFTPTLVLVAWQDVSYFIIADAAGSVLTVFTHFCPPWLDSL